MVKQAILCLVLQILVHSLNLNELTPHSRSSTTHQGVERRGWRYPIRRRERQSSRAQGPQTTNGSRTPMTTDIVWWIVFINGLIFIILFYLFFILLI